MRQVFVSVSWYCLIRCTHYTGQELKHLKSHNSYLVQANETGISRLNDIEISNVELEEVTYFFTVLLVRIFVYFNIRPLRH